MSTNRGKVLIAGGGIGGLMTALTLAGSGYAVHVLERAEKFEEAGAGVQLGPNATAILRKWGLLDLIETRLVRPGEIRIMDAVSDAEVARVPLGDRFAARFGAPYAVVHRADLHKALLQACLATPDIDLETGQSISGYEETPDGVTLRTENGAAIEGEALVGADGIWSAIRDQLMRESEPEFSGHIAYRTLIPAERMPEAFAWNASTVWMGPDTHLVHYPVSGGAMFNIVAVATGTWRGRNWNIAADTQEVLEAFARSGTGVRRILSAGTGYRKWALADLPPLASWSRGRVTLAGDAAHAVLPYLAQGAAMAIEDADQLAESLEMAGGDFEAGFPHYETMRRGRTARLYKASRFNGSTYHATGPKRLIRNQVMKHLSHESWYKRIAWIYDGPKGN